MGGDNCCIVDCHTCASRCRGLSFHKLPKASENKEKNEWRKRLIAVINRCDKFFNPDRATICSRHFEQECFTENGRGRILKVGSMPTRFLPVKSIQTPAIVPRKEPAKRAPPPLVERVTYFNVDDVRKHAASLPSPWFVIPTLTGLQIGLLDGLTLKYKVEICDDLRALVYVYGMKAMTTSIEKVRLSVFLKTITETCLCVGIEDPSVQNLVPLSSQTLSFGRHVRPVTDDQTLSFHSTIRSSVCTVVTNGTSTSTSSPNLCGPCGDVLRLIQRKKERAQRASNAPIKPHTPLIKIPKSKLVEEVRNFRKRDKLLLKRIRELEGRLDERSAEEGNGGQMSIRSAEEGNGQWQNFMDMSGLPDHQYAEWRPNERKTPPKKLKLSPSTVTAHCG